VSYQEAKRITLSKKYPIFSWGYVDNVFDIDMNDNQSPYLRNCRIDWGSVRSRPWYLTFKALDWTTKPFWLWSYLRTDPTNDRIVVRHNQDTDKKLITLTEWWVLAEIDTSTNIASDNRMNFVNVWDVIYCMNGSDQYWKLSWTTYTVPNVGVPNFKPRFGIMFNSSMFVSWWTANPNKVYKSVWDNYDDFNSAWSDIFTFEEHITGLAATTQWLFYFTKNSISATGTSDIQDTAGTVSYITRVMNAKEWANNHESIVSAGINIFFLTPNNKICQLMRGESDNGFEVRELSHRTNNGISKLMESLDPDQTDSFGYYLPKESLIKRHLKSLWSQFNDTVVIYDVIKNIFLIDTNQYFYDGIMFKGRYYTASTLEPRIFLDEYGYSDDDTPIPFEYRTKRFHISDPTIKKIIWESRSLVAINELAECEQSIRTDKWQIDSKIIWWWLMKSLGSWGIGTTPIGTEPIWEEWFQDDLLFDEDMEDIDVLRTKGNLNEIFKKIQWRRVNNSLAGKVILKTLSPKIEIKPELATNLTI
jgi:hypothetical protein